MDEGGRVAIGTNSRNTDGSRLRVSDGVHSRLTIESNPSPSGTITPKSILNFKAASTNATVKLEAGELELRSGNGRIVVDDDGTICLGTGC